MDNMTIFSATVEEMQKSIRRLKSRTMKQLGIGTSDLSCLMVLAKNPGGLTSTELSRVCDVDKALISRSVKKLQAMDLITYIRPRIPTTLAECEDPAIVRRGSYRVQLILTPHGAEVMELLYGVTKAASAAALADLEEPRRQMFLEALIHVNERLGGFVREYEMRTDNSASE